MKKREILGIIPARGGSKGIPRKNLRLVGGKPLIHYAIEEGKKSRLITRLILSSEDEEIIDYCKNKGIEVPFKRPLQLAEDDTPMLEVVLHAIDFFKKEESYCPQYIIILQPTSPLRTHRHIDEALEKLINSDADSIVSVIEVPHNFNPYSVMEFNGKYLRAFLKFDESLNLRQKKPKFFARNGPAILAFTYNCLVNKKSMYGEKILPYFMKKEDSFDIDEEIDLKIAEYILQNR